MQLGLVLGIGWMLGPGGHWLIGLPLAGIAVNKLQALSRWLVYIVLIAVIMLPIGLRYSTWKTAFLNGFIISTAILFVAVFSQFRLNEQKAREKAEELAKQLDTENHQLAEYALQAEELALTQGRNRLAREIHDNLGHYLTIINVQYIQTALCCYRARLNRLSLCRLFPRSAHQPQDRDGHRFPLASRRWELENFKRWS